jgi:hypothetical protein
MIYIFLIRSIKNIAITNFYFKSTQVVNFIKFTIADKDVDNILKNVQINIRNEEAAHMACIQSLSQFLRIYIYIKTFKSKKYFFLDRNIVTKMIYLCETLNDLTNLNKKTKQAIEDVYNYAVNSIHKKYIFTKCVSLETDEDTWRKNKYYDPYQFDECSYEVPKKFFINRQDGAPSRKEEINTGYVENLSLKIEEDQEKSKDEYLQSIADYFKLKTIAKIDIENFLSIFFEPCLNNILIKKQIINTFM